MGGSFKFIGRRHEVPVFFFDLPEKVMQFGRVLFFKRFWTTCRASDEPVQCQQIGERQVVAIVVGRGSDFLSLLEKGTRPRRFFPSRMYSSPRLWLASKLCGSRSKRFFQSVPARVRLSQTNQIRGQIGSARRPDSASGAQLFRDAGSPWRPETPRNKPSLEAREPRSCQEPRAAVFPVRRSFCEAVLRRNGRVPPGIRGRVRWRFAAC